jgi:Tetracyclin repressor-like, C-terminal domain
MAKDLHGMLTRHPWLVSAFGSQVLYGPGKARHDDHNLAVYEMAGFIGPEADRAVATVFTFVLGNALGESATVSLMRRLGREGGNPEDRLREAMAKAIEIGMQFPRLRARLEGGADVGYATAPENSLDLGLNALFEGLEKELATRRRPSS